MLMKSPALRGAIGVVTGLAALGFLRYETARIGGASGDLPANAATTTAAATDSPNKTPREMLQVGFLPVT